MGDNVYMGASSLEPEVWDLLSRDLQAGFRV